MSIYLEFDQEIRDIIAQLPRISRGNQALVSLPISRNLLRHEDGFGQSGKTRPRNYVQKHVLRHNLCPWFCSEPWRYVCSEDDKLWQRLYIFDIKKLF